MDGMEPEEWIKNKKTGKEEWRPEVTAENKTPKGYSYIGKEDNDILNVGYLASDAENEGPAAYSASHAVKVQVTTSLSVTPAVSVNFDLKAGKVSKEFLGVQ